MLTKRFEALFQKLVAAFARHQDAPRKPDEVVALASARWDLELARRAIAEERDRLAVVARAHKVLPVRKTDVSDIDIVRLRLLGSA